MTEHGMMLEIFGTLAISFVAAIVVWNWKLTREHCKDLIAIKIWLRMPIKKKKKKTKKLYGAALYQKMRKDARQGGKPFDENRVGKSKRR